MNTPNPIERKIEEFEQEFGELVLGNLSGEKGSPVFVNNELENPRMLSWLRSALEEMYEAGRKEERERIVAELKKRGWDKASGDVREVIELLSTPTREGCCAGCRQQHSWQELGQEHPPCVFGCHSQGEVKECDCKKECELDRKGRPMCDCECHLNNKQ